MTDLHNDSPHAIKKPTQARSVATFAHILDAATEIVVERGIQGLNTNLVADRAGVNIGTVYHYFPDKTAILIELFRLDQQQRSVYLFEKLSELPGAKDITVWGRELFALVKQLRDEHPATVLMRRAFRSVPELVIIDNLDVDQSTQYLSGLLRERFPALDANRAHYAARLLIETTATIMDSALAEGPHDAAFIEEGLNFMNSYLASFE